MEKVSINVKTTDKNMWSELCQGVWEIKINKHKATKHELEITHEKKTTEK